MNNRLLIAGMCFCIAHSYGTIKFDDETNFRRKFPDKNITDVIVDFDLTNVDLSGWIFTNVVFKQGAIANSNFTAATLLGKP